MFEGPAERVCIQVRDDSMTLTPEQLAQAWTPYYQGENTLPVKCLGWAWDWRLLRQLSGGLVGHVGSLIGPSGLA